MNVKIKWNALLMVVLLVGLVGCNRNHTSSSPVAVEGLDNLGVIEVVSREEGSGTRSTFAALADFEQKQEGQAQPDLTRKDARIENNAEGVIEAVKENSSAIGYVSGGALQDVEGLKCVSVNGISMEAQEGAYPLSRNFYLAYCGKLNDLEQDFLTYIHSEGQEIVGEAYIPIAKSNTFLSNQAEGTIRITGSTSIAPLMEQLAQAYMEINPHADIQVNATDSTDGLTQAMSGSCDFGMSSRALKDFEMELLDYEMIAEDNIAVIVNEENPLEDISLADLKRVYTGEIEEWQELNP